MFAQRLKIIEASTTIVDPEPFVVAYLKIAKVELDEKIGWRRPHWREIRELLQLPVVAGSTCGYLDQDSQNRLRRLQQVLATNSGTARVSSSQTDPARSVVKRAAPSQDLPDKLHLKRVGRWFAATYDGDTAIADVGLQLQDALQSVSSKFCGVLDLWDTDPQTTCSLPG